MLKSFHEGEYVMKKRIGILGGTFDPPHMGHLIIAETVKDTMELDEVWFIPASEPPHKSKANATAEERVAMVEMAIHENEAFKINDIEVNRKGTSYTIDTVKALQLQFPENQFYFIIGADMVAYLPNWYQIDELLANVTFIGVQREGYPLESKYPIKTVDVPFIPISSTMIRQRLSEKRSIRYLVPHSVYSFIEERGLYGNK